MTLPLPIWIHLIAALGALVLGGLQLARRVKGDRAHRIVGWAYVVLMLVVAISSLWIPAFLDFSPIHIFTAVTFVALPLGIYRARQRNFRRHATAMTALYAGGLVIAGVFTLMPGRVLGKALIAWVSG